MFNLEHPSITKAERTGYPNKSSKPEHWGIDIFGDEILVGDSIIVLPNDEILLVKNIEDYLIEIIGVKYKTAD